MGPPSARPFQHAMCHGEATAAKVRSKKVDLLFFCLTDSKLPLGISQCGPCFAVMIGVGITTNTIAKENDLVGVPRCLLSTITPLYKFAKFEPSLTLGVVLFCSGPHYGVLGMHYEQEVP